MFRFLTNSPAMRVRLVLLAACLCVLAGCHTPDVNPASPQKGKGYVDFYTESYEGVSWKIKRATGPNGQMKDVFSEFKPITSNILRLAVPTGTNEFQVWISNEVTTGPTNVLVLIKSQEVTPVKVSLVPAGSIAVLEKSVGYRSTARATRQVSKISTEEQDRFQIAPVPGTPQPYSAKQAMPYFSAQAK
jgi:hypothetical protein